jgi:hypothetical protein
LRPIVPAVRAVLISTSRPGPTRAESSRARGLRRRSTASRCAQCPRSTSGTSYAQAAIVNSVEESFTSQSD